MKLCKKNNRHNILKLFIFLIIIGLYYFAIIKSNKPNNIVGALSSFKSITSQDDWDVGNFSNSLDLLTNPGTIQLYLETEPDYLSGAWSTNGNGDVADLYDNSTATGIDLDLNEWFKWNAETTISNVTKLKIYRINGPESAVDSLICLYPKAGAVFTCPGAFNDWANFSVFGNGNLPKDIWETKDITDADRSQFSLTNSDFSQSYTISEFEVYYAPMSATHTTLFGQIGATGDAERYVVDWEALTILESEPANSNVIYRLRRTNQNGTWTGDWTENIDYIGSLINLSDYSGLDLSQDDIVAGRTYLQIEATISRTDVSAEPSISDYTVTYHTNKVPNAPSAQ